MSDNRPTYGFDPRFGQRTWQIGGYSARNEVLNRTQGFDVGYGYAIIPWTSDPDRPELNDYPNQFTDLFSSRVGNAEYVAVISRHAQMIMGNGIDILPDPVLQAADPIVAEFDTRRAKAMFDQAFLFTAAYDLAMFRSFAAQECMELGQTVQGGMGLRPYKVYGQRIPQVRVGPPRMNADGIYRPQWYYISEDWTQVDIFQGGTQFYVQANAYMPHAILAKDVADSHIDELCRVLGIDDEAQVTQLKLRRLHWDMEYSPAGFYYPVSSAECALAEMQLAAQSVQFHLAALNNTAYAGGLLIIPKQIKRDPQTGNLSNEEFAEQEAIATKWQEQLAGAKNAGQTAILFRDPNDGPESVPEFLSPPSNDNDARFLATQAMARERTLIAVQALDPALYGIPTKTGFSNKADQLRASYQLVEASITGPLRKRLLTYMNDTLKRAGIQARVNITYEMPFPDSPNVTVPA